MSGEDEDTDTVQRLRDSGSHRGLLRRRGGALLLVRPQDSHRQQTGQQAPASPSLLLLLLLLLLHRAQLRYLPGNFPALFRNFSYSLSFPKRQKGVS